ncbi:MAG: RNA polymerase factor sigma-54 [Fimbriimonadaceae bacterium]|nr:RNA polymerase factor sigma-54 [Fimbriimonadaceae bacterium]
MQLVMATEARLEQTLSPRMIQFYQMLQCPQPELDALISTELAENPALELIERAEPSGDEADEAVATTDAGGGHLPLARSDEADDPVAALPAPVSLQDHLRWHFQTIARTPLERRIGRRIIEDVNPDGYFESGIGEVAMVLAVSVVEVERVLALVQQLDPPGVAARDLRECLEIQLRQHREQGRDQTVASKLLERSWEPFCRRQYAVCARQLRVSEAAVVDAAEFFRRHCHPYPGRQFRLPWQATGSAPRAVPEVTFRECDAPPPAYLVEVSEARHLVLRVDRIYRQLYDELAESGSGDHETHHVTSCVRRARQFIRSLQQRRDTVRRIAQELAAEQEDFLRYGPAHLKPLTRLEIARRLGLHESTVGRAVAGKLGLLPSGEVVLLERFFDGAQPVKLALQELLAAEDRRRPWSDQALVEQLQAQGYDLARRTVAKYRSELKVPPASQRRR